MCASLAVPLPWQTEHRTAVSTFNSLVVPKAASSNVINFIESGDDDGGAVVYIFGHDQQPFTYPSKSGQRI